MTLSRTVKFVLAALAALVALVALAAWLSWSRLEMYAAGVHQKAVTQELRGWGTEYAAVTNDASAVAAAEMVGYMSQYYIPGPGYRGPAEVEVALQSQRAASIERITGALEHFTGLVYGTDAQRWAEWADLRKKELGRKGNSEPDGATNRSQPVHSETNRTSVATGSGR
jgi:hypothetical protein